MDWKGTEQQVCQAGAKLTSFSARAILTEQVDSINDTTRQDLLEVLKSGTHPSALADLSKRKLIEKKKIYYFSVEKGESFSLDVKKQETDISVEMLQTYLT